MKTSLPTLLEMQELTAFLPVLYAEGFSPITGHYGGDKDASTGRYNIPYPRYDENVTNFFKLASKECWIDYEYDPKAAGQLLENEEVVHSASIEQIKTVLTYCTRGERFCDGHWDTVIQKGYIKHLLERLLQLQSEIESD